jgi:predicted DNA-binding ribbon-helix-helix protein
MGHVDDKIADEKSCYTVSLIFSGVIPSLDKRTNVSSLTRLIVNQWCIDRKVSNILQAVKFCTSYVECVVDGGGGGGVFG